MEAITWYHQINTFAVSKNEFKYAGKYALGLMQSQVMKKKS